MSLGILLNEKLNLKTFVLFEAVDGRRFIPQALWRRYGSTTWGPPSGLSGASRKRVEPPEAAALIVLCAPLKAARRSRIARQASAPEFPGTSIAGPRIIMTNARGVDGHHVRQAWGGAWPRWQYWRHRLAEVLPVRKQSAETRTNR